MKKSWIQAMYRISWSMLLIMTVSLLVMLTTASFAQTAATSPANAEEFFKNATGDWVGWCEQSTDGAKDECKFFHATLSQADPTTFTANFEYYKLDSASNTPTHIGSTSVTSVIQPDGTVKNKINGQGTILVSNKPKQQNHELDEVLTYVGDGKFTGTINGHISVDGMPLNLGQNGRISNSTSTWTLNNGELVIEQNIKAGFRVLLFSKNFGISARSTAKRGTDVMSLMLKHTAIAAQPDGTAPGG